MNLILLINSFKCSLKAIRNAYDNISSENIEKMFSRCTCKHTDITNICSVSHTRTIKCKRHLWHKWPVLYYWIHLLILKYNLYIHITVFFLLFSPAFIIYTITRATIQNIFVWCRSLFVGWYHGRVKERLWRIHYLSMKQ